MRPLGDDATDHLSGWDGAGDEVLLAAGETLVEEGEPGDDVFVLRAGRLAAYQMTPAGELLLAEMAEGAVLGEIAADAGGRRTATVRALVDSSVVRIARADLTDWLERNPRVAEAFAEQARARIDRSQVAVFVTRLIGTVDSTLVQAIAERMDWVDLEAGDVLFREGDPSDAAYFVITGRVLVSAARPSGEAILREVGRGEVIGELGLIDRSPRSATVRAVRDTTLARFSVAVFEELTRRNPSLTLQVARAILGRIERARPLVERSASLAVAVAAPTDGHALVARLVDEHGRRGSVTHLWSERVDELLGQPGVAQAPPGVPGARRLGELLHESDAGHEHLVYETDPSATPWSRRVLRHADRAVIVVSPNPGPDEDRRIREFLGALVGLERLRRWLAVLHPPGVARPTGTAALLRRYGVDEVIHVRAGSAEDLGRLGRLTTGRGVGLVLGGGGARGFAHIGVFRALRELGVPIDHIGGASIGAPLGAGMAVGMSPQELLVNTRRQFQGLLDYTVPLVSFVKGARITRNIRAVFDGWDIEDAWFPFFCVSTNLTRSALEVHTRGDVTSAVRASIAIPGVLPPVPRGDDLLVDGGVLNNLPVDVMRRTGTVGTVIAVDVAPPVGPRARRDYGLSVSGWQALRARFGPGRSDYPGVVAVLLRSMVVGSTRDRNELVAAGVVDLQLEPELRGVGLLDFDRVVPVAEAGYRAARPAIEAWLAGAGREWR
jgi:predicted acylesterase/phospholipase RssA/CRP-like cAMP-binding protein